MSRRRRHEQAALAAAALAAIAYAAAVPNGFTNWDDRALVLAEPSAQSLGLDNIGLVLRQPVGRAYLPLRTLSYALDYALWGPRPQGYHLTNVVLHAANAALACAVLAALTGSLRTGFFAAALFALHPLQTEAVAWIAGRRDVLYTFFFLAAMWWYLRAMRRGERGWTAAGLLLLSGLAKAPAVVFPALAAVCEWMRPSPRGRRARQASVWLVALALAAVHVSVGRRKEVIQPYHGRTFLHNLATSSKAVCRYAQALAWPVPLATKHEFPPASNPLWLAGPLVLLLAAAAGLRGRTPVGLGLAWFLIGLAPVSGAVFPLSYPYAERYAYVPCLGVFLAFAWAARGRAAAAWALAALLPFAALTMRRAFDWRGSESLWESAARVYPDSGDIAKSLLFTYTEDGKLEQAAAVAARMSSAHVDPLLALINQAQAFLRLQRYVDARGKAVDAISLRPDDARGYVVAGDVERARGERESAAAFYRQALARDPQCFGAHFGLGVLLEAKRPKAALAHYKAAVAANPKSPEAHYNLGNAAAALGYNNLAERAYRAAIRLKPDYAQAWCNLGALYKTQRNHRRALAAFRRAVEIQPDLPQANFHLALYEEALGRRGDAIRRLQRVLKKHPRSRAVREELERMLARERSR